MVGVSKLEWREWAGAWNSECCCSLLHVFVGCLSTPIAITVDDKQHQRCIIKSLFFYFTVKREVTFCFPDYQIPLFRFKDNIAPSFAFTGKFVELPGQSNSGVIFSNDY